MPWRYPRGLSSELIGRDADLQTLLMLAATVRTGQGQTGLVAGEAGVGKSRLVAELRDTLERDGFRVCEGQCFEVDQALPYAPVLDLLRAQLDDLSPERVGTILGLAAPVLASLLPELDGFSPVEPPVPRLDPAREKQRLAYALVRLFAAWSEHQPLLLIFEDVHWADGASLELLFYLVRHLAGSRVLLILTYRGEDRTPDLERLLAEVNRGRLATDITLAPLTEREVGWLVARGFGLDRPPGAAFIHALHTLSDGNPYFIEEVLAALAAEHAIVDVEGRWERRLLTDLRIPHTIAEAVRRRMDLLSPAARQVLDLAAVAGRRFDFTLLQSLTGHDEADLLRLLKELVTARLVVEQSVEEFAFHHALTRQAVYLQLLARANAEAAGLSDRVRFAVRDAVTLTPAIDGTYDLVCVFEAIHDMAQPVPALRAARLLARAGTVLVMDERVPDTFSAPGDDLDRFFYGASVFVCLPTGMAQEPSAGTGTVMRTSTFREYATAAGFQAVDVLPIEHDFYRFYRLTP